MHKMTISLDWTDMDDGFWRIRALGRTIATASDGGYKKSYAFCDLTKTERQLDTIEKAKTWAIGEIRRYCEGAKGTGLSLPTELPHIFPGELPFTGKCRGRKQVLHPISLATFAAFSKETLA